MRVIIAGSRHIIDYSLVETAVKESKFDVTEIVSGHAKGVDLLGELYAKEHKLPITYFIPDWEKFGSAAGPIRNREMAKYADALVAVWDTKSIGTKGMINLARKYNLPIYIKLVSIE